MRLIRKVTICFVLLYIAQASSQENKTEYFFDQPVEYISNAGYKIVTFGSSSINYSLSPLITNSKQVFASVSPLGNEAFFQNNKKIGIISLSNFRIDIEDKYKLKNDLIVDVIPDEFGKTYYVIFESGKLGSTLRDKRTLNIEQVPIDNFVSKAIWNNNLKKLLIADDLYLYYLDPTNGSVGEGLSFKSDITFIAQDLNTFEVFVGLANGSISSWSQDLKTKNYEISLTKNNITSIQPDPLDHYLFVGDSEGTIHTINRLTRNVVNSSDYFSNAVRMKAIYDERLKNKFLAVVGGSQSLKILDITGLEPNYRRVINDSITKRREQFLKFRDGESSIKYDERVNPKNLSQYLDGITQSMIDSIARTKSTFEAKYEQDGDSLKVNIEPFPELKFKAVKNVKNTDQVEIVDIHFELESDNTFSISNLLLLSEKDTIRYSSDLRTMRYYEEVLELNLAKEIAKKELEFKDALTDLVDRLRSRGKLADVDLSVESVLKKEKDSLGRDELNLHLTFLSQGIKAEAENETADFPPGKYSLLDSEAATALVDFFVKSSAEKLAEYLKPETRITFKITGSTDKSPISGKIPYNSEFGNFKNFPYYFQGDLSGMNLNEKSGITENSQLGFLRTYSVRNFIENSTEVFDFTKKKFIHFSEEAEEYGPEYRRIKIEMIIHQIDKIIKPKESEDKSITLSDVDINIPTGPKVKGYALVIGNEDYSSYQSTLTPESNVPYAQRDAEIFTNYLTQMYGLSRENIFLLKNATYGEISQNIAKLERLMVLDGEDSEIIVFYSGHGMPDEQTKDPYLMPVDISGLNVNQGISLKELMTRLNNKPHRKIDFIIDACFSGLGKSKPLAEVKGISVVPVNPELGDNMILISSSSSNESSVVDDDNQHGLFTYHLLKILKESEGKSDIQTLFDKLSKDVGLSAIRKYNKVQTPSILLGKNINASKSTTRLISEDNSNED
ncbi:MAG: caspase family protein [Flavobacteriaceae bacterium]